MHPDEEDYSTFSNAEIIVAEIKELRVSIDALRNKAAMLADQCRDEENGLVGMNHCVDKLVEAKMWAGQSLGELGHKLPVAYRDEFNLNA